MTHRQKHVYTCPEISELFGAAPHWFVRNWSRYVAAGFPPPLPGVGHKRFSKPAVDRWFETNGETWRPAEPEPEADRTDELVGRLDELYPEKETEDELN